MAVNESHIPGESFTRRTSYGRVRRKQDAEARDRARLTQPRYCPGCGGTGKACASCLLNAADCLCLSPDLRDCNQCAGSGLTIQSRSPITEPLTEQGATMAKTERTPITDLRQWPERWNLDSGDVEVLESTALRIIELKTEIRRANEELGYTDSSGVRHPGLTDELLLRLAELRLDTGLRIEDWSLYEKPWTQHRITKEGLLAQGVDPDTIVAATSTSCGITLEVRQDRERREV